MRGVRLGFTAVIAVAACGRLDFAPMPPIELMQAATGSGSDASNAVALDHVAEHDAIIACFTFPSGSNALQSIGDSLGNSFVAVVGPVVSNGYTHYVALAADSPAGADTVTVELAGSAAKWEVLAFDYAGLTSTPFDTSAYQFGTGSAMTSGPITTTAAHELLLAYAHSTDPVADPGFTALASGDDNLVEELLVLEPGDYAVTGATTPGIWTMMLAAFKGG